MSNSIKTSKHYDGLIVILIRLREYPNELSAKWIWKSYACQYRKIYQLYFVISQNCVSRGGYTNKTDAVSVIELTFNLKVTCMGFTWYAYCLTPNKREFFLRVDIILEIKAQTKVCFITWRINTRMQSMVFSFIL